ncbi:MAG TPA: cupredoxin family copper-binding protein [Candidatus Limnocylindria bacterium]
MSRIAARLPLLLVIAGGALLVVPIGPTRAATHAVTIADFAFGPQELTITAGDTVTWTNEDAMVHTATSVNGAFDSGDLAQGASYSLTFTSPGTYDYLCTPHPSMTGRIVVLAAPTPSAAPSGELPNVALAGDTSGPPLRAIGGALVAASALLLVRGSRRQRIPVS